MFVSILVGLIIGFILAMPPGPVAVTAIKFSLDKGVKRAIFFGFGTGLMDFIYCTVIVFATSAVFQIIDTFAEDFPELKFLFQFAVVLAIMIYGFLHLKNTKKSIDIENVPQNNSKIVNKLSNKGPFFIGIALALANIANPTFLPTLAYVTMNVQGLNLIENNFFSNLFFAIGFGLGNLSWIYLLIKVVNHYKSKMSERFLAKINQFAGLTLIGFGTLLGYRILFPKLAEIFRFVFAF